MKLNNWHRMIITRPVIQVGYFAVSQGLYKSWEHPPPPKFILQSKTSTMLPIVHFWQGILSSLQKRKYVNK